MRYPFQFWLYRLERRYRVNRTVFTGLTWSHQRGYAPLRRLAQLAAVPGELAVPHSRVNWEAQDLAGFESHPIAALADRYDLLVLDHPGLGAAVSAGALVPLDEALRSGELATWRTATIGDCYESYTYAAHQWALPIDAAAQICAYRPDLLPNPPRTWDDALSLHPALPVAVPTRGPHTLLTFLGIAAAHDPTFQPGRRHLVPPEIATAAYDMLRRAVARTPQPLRDLDPIQLLDRMGHQPLACIPLVFGYVTYSGAGAGPYRIHVADAPALTLGAPPGSVLGGTGLAVSARLRDNPLVLDHLRQAMHPLAQCRVVPDAGGQPSAAAAWDDPAVNASWWDFFAATRRTIQHAWRRPRYPGWIAVQSAGSAVLRDALHHDLPAATALADLNACYATYTPTGADR